MRPALAIVNNFEAKKMVTPTPNSPNSTRFAPGTPRFAPGSPGSPRPATSGAAPTPQKEEKTFELGKVNAAKLATENKSWISAVRKLTNAQQSIFLKKSQD